MLAPSRATMNEEPLCMQAISFGQGGFYPKDQQRWKPIPQ